MIAVSINLDLISYSSDWRTCLTLTQAKYNCVYKEFLFEEITNYLILLETA